MASKKVVDRERALAVLRHAVDAHMPEVAREVTALLTPELKDGESVPDPYAQADLLLRRLERLFGRLLSADEDVLNLRAERKARGDEVNAAAADLLSTGRRRPPVVPRAGGPPAG